MVRRFAGRLCPIVAVETGSGHIGMVKSRAGKRIGVVAILAFVARLRVAGRLARGLDAIVARHAALRCSRVVEPVDRPLAGCVTAVAFRLRYNMVCRLAVGAHIIVASRTGLGRALEDGRLVACLAGNGHMSARQRKSRREMIEGGFARR